MKYSNLIRESEAARILGGPRQMRRAKIHGITPMLGGFYSKSLIEAVFALVNPKPKTGNPRKSRPNRP